MTVEIPDYLREAMEASGVDPDEVARKAADPDVIASDEHEQLRQAAVQAEGLRCAECRDGVNPLDPNVLHEIKGWSKHRSQGGQNHVIGRVETGRMLCPGCGYRLIHLGVTPGQESLL